MLNPKRNRFGWFGRLRRRVKRKSHPKSGSNGQSSYDDALEITLSQAISAYAPVPPGPSVGIGRLH